MADRSGYLGYKQHVESPNTNVYLGFADPWQDYSQDECRQLLALHSMIFQAPIIQDDFLLTGQAFRLTTGIGTPAVGDPLLRDLLESRILTVALRTTSESLDQLRDGQAKKAAAGTFFPFKGDTAALYGTVEFVKYAQDLDRVLAEPPRKFRWEPSEIGEQFRARMESSLTSEEWSFEEIRRATFKKVDLVARGRTQSCSDYFNVVKEGTKFGKVLRSWARAHYLTNLGIVCPLTTALPARLLMSHRVGQDVHVLPWNEAAADDELATGLFNPLLLMSVRADEIRELRSSSSFQNLQQALANPDKDPAGVQAWFTAYKKHVAERAPSFIKEHRDAIASATRSKTRSELGKKLAPTASASIALLASYFAQHPVAVTAGLGAVALSTMFDKLGQKADQEREMAILAARERLRISSQEGGILSLVSTLHYEDPQSAAVVS